MPLNVGFNNKMEIINGYSKCKEFEIIKLQNFLGVFTFNYFLQIIIIYKLGS